ncbi:histidine phosphatase family protein [Clostridium sp. SHJSY1]|uniref:histidine phosphatase family protein n=1 Tax=Clostridium sp. SHJSY1 TaxID=2942483 RepID=UPI0028751A99|nr:histidine phosphatase family protein [Clostridium sp. SHJSY1]MDS0527548.1 histidine phosphatase family protein [Clostridium sp. SHJSY1]
MKTTLFLVRHGETKWNALGKFQGCTDIDLSDEGIIQANFLKERVENSFDFIYSSPLKRANDTANIICSNTEPKPVIEPAIREINFGEWEGLTLKEIVALYPENFKVWRTDELTAPICGGDLSIKMASIRAKEAILKIVEAHKGKRIMIVAHGGIIKAGLIGLFNWKMTMYHQIILGNTSICKLSFNDDLKPVIVSINDTSHLPNNYNVKSFV